MHTHTLYSIQHTVILHTLSEAREAFIEAWDNTEDSTW